MLSTQHSCPKHAHFCRFLECSLPSNWWLVKRTASQAAVSSLVTTDMLSAQCLCIKHVHGHEASVWSLPCSNLLMAEATLHLWLT